MNGPIPPPLLRSLQPGETGEAHSYGDMYGGVHGAIASHWKDAHAPRPPVAQVRQPMDIEPIEVIRERVAANQRRGAPAPVEPPIVEGSVEHIREIIAKNQRGAAKTLTL